ncbi:putative disease resistance protein RGA1 [Silene latifolia]|uniref:putative disease resistance protein RGA1 n=1 Tax=Silene latifolia TaxID=37657 RepID=UPI003D781BE5
MDLATVLSIVQTILSAIQALNQLTSTFSLSQYKNELERFEKTVRIVESVLVDADDKQGALSRQQAVYIQELKDAIYDANDVLDEFVTLVKQKTVADTQNKLTNKVRSFLSPFSLRLHNLSCKVNDVNKKLNDIASNSSKFLFKVENKPDRFLKPESSSFVTENEIIGRDKDLEKVVGMLLNSNDVVDQANNVSCLAIVGMGGLGKTAFAQLVYSDPRVSSAFDLKCWTCIADQDQWNLTEILGKIVKELLKSNTHGITSLEQMHLELRKQLKGKKYLLVLDDVWTENYHRWQDLEKVFRTGASGSRIVATTRSKKTAQIIGDVRVYELQGLPEEKSWLLFERMAFLPRQLESPDDELIKLGKEIVKKCINVPLAIRVVASLLRGEPKSKWLSFRDNELAHVRKSDDTMDNILRLSYHQLDFSLKSCFSYCAIFPKDFVIEKKLLVSLWMAQGYISTEYVGEEYCLMLLQRCFFQDSMVDEWGEIRKFKIHDLLHDIAEQVADKDICRLSSHALNVGNKVRHLSLLDDFCLQKSFNKTHIRTCVQITLNQSSSDELLRGNSLANWTCLRSLDLRSSDAHTLPESIGELFHLRWLNLSLCTNLYALPESISKLVNLQILDLSKCFNLRKLPRNLSNLLDLTTLNLTDCVRLSHMPYRMGLLTQLDTLGLFVVGREGSKAKQCFGGLEELRCLSNVKGFLEVRIWVHDNANYVKKGHGKGASLRNKEHLQNIKIDFKGRELQNKEPERYDRALLEAMQPHHDLKGLELNGYNGEIMPTWLGRGDNTTLFRLPNLVNLVISNCFKLRCLTWLGKLPHLKVLTLLNLPRVEYVLNAEPEASVLGEGTSLFPRLQKLSVIELSNLKGWWPRSRLEVQNQQYVIVSKSAPCFAQLRELWVTDCEMLKSIPICSSLVLVRIRNSSHRYTWDNIDNLHRYFQSLIQDSNSRIVSFVNNNINTELATALRYWVSTHGYTFLGVPDT